MTVFSIVHSVYLVILYGARKGELYRLHARLYYGPDITKTYTHPKSMVASNKLPKMPHRGPPF